MFGGLLKSFRQLATPHATPQRVCCAMWAFSACLFAGQYIAPLLRVLVCCCTHIWTVNMAAAFTTVSVTSHVEALLKGPQSIEKIAALLQLHSEQPNVTEVLDSMPKEVSVDAADTGVVVPSTSPLAAAIHVRRLRRALFRLVPRQNARAFAADFDSSWRSGAFGEAIRGGMHRAAESVTRAVAAASDSASVTHGQPATGPVGHAQHTIAMIAKWAISALLNGADMLLCAADINTHCVHRVTAGPTQLSTLQDQVLIAAKYARLRLSQADISTGIELLGLLGLLAVQECEPTVSVTRTSKLCAPWNSTAPVRRTPRVKRRHKLIKQKHFHR